MESRVGRIRLSKDFRTIGVCVETGGLSILPNVTCFYTYISIFVPASLNAEESYWLFCFKENANAVNVLGIKEGQL